MKKLISLVLVLLFMGMNVEAATLQSAITKYKNGNYTGCINDMDEYLLSMAKNKEDKDISKKLVQIISKYDYKKWQNPNLSDADRMEIVKCMDEIQKYISKDYLDRLAYIFYYDALSLHQLGYGDVAKGFYAAAYIVTWESKSKINTYSLQAIACLESPNTCQNSDMDNFIRSGKQVSDTIIKDELKKNLEKQKNEINQGKGLSYENSTSDKIAWVDAGVSDINEIGKNETNAVSNDMPTDEEIGRAVRTLQRAGINPVSYMSSPVNNEYAQLNALLNSENNNYSNDYATMMMMNGGTNKLSPEVMQTLMRQQMMGGYGF